MLIMGSHHYVQMSEQDMPDPGLLDSVRLIMPTGASVPRVCTDKLQRKLPKCVLHVNLYGQTESGTVVLGNLEYEGLGPIKPGCSIKARLFILGHTWLGDPHFDNVMRRPRYSRGTRGFFVCRRGEGVIFYSLEKVTIGFLRGYLC